MVEKVHDVRSGYVASASKTLVSAVHIVHIDWFNTSALLRGAIVVMLYTNFHVDDEHVHDDVHVESK